MSGASGRKVGLVTWASTQGEADGGWSQKEQDRTELDNETLSILLSEALEMFLSSVCLNVQAATLAQL